MSLLNVGDTAPAFALKNQDGQTVSLKDMRGKWVVLYFYPKALTPGCTTQACALRDHDVLQNHPDIKIIGVSADAPALLKKFEEKEGLNFTLVGNPEHDMLKAYGAWQEKSMYGRKYMGIARMTYIISPAGKVAHIMPKVAPKEHTTKLTKWFESEGVLHVG